MSDLGCHVHVGMSKTGTTSIQETLSTVVGQSARYLPAKGTNHGMIFSNLFEARPWRHVRHLHMGHTKQDVLAMRSRQRKHIIAGMNAATKDPNTRSIIFSAERMSSTNVADEQATLEFRNFFSQWCSEFRVYGYIRPVSGFVTSAFQQIIKTYGKPDLEASVRYPHYREKFEKFDRVFGQSNVSLRRFVRSDLTNGDVVQDIADQIGLDITHCPTQVHNESLSLEAIALLFTIRRSEYVEDPVRASSIGDQLVTPLLSKIGGGKFGLDPKISVQLIEQNAEDIAWIENRIGASVTNLDSPVENPIRNNQDILDVAAESVQLLDSLEGDPIFLDSNFTLKDMKRWVEQGLNTAHPNYRSSSSIRRLRRKTCS